MEDLTRVMIVEVTKLSLKTGDTLAVKVPPNAPAEQIEKIASTAHRILPAGVQMVIIPKDVDLVVVAPWDGD